MMMEEAKEKLDFVSGMFTLNSILVHVLLDSGDSFSFVSTSIVPNLITSLIPLDESF